MTIGIDGNLLMMENNEGYNGRMLKVDLKTKEITVLADGPGRQSATERTQLTCALPDLAGCPDLRRDDLLHRAGHHDCFIAGQRNASWKADLPQRAVDGISFAFLYSSSSGVRRDPH